MPPTMKAIVAHQLRQPLSIVDWPRPEPGPGQILIEVTACGVCHSDLHAIDGDWTPLPVLPLIPGHEVTGHVAGLGEGVGEFKPGDRVGVPWMWSACGACEFCHAGMETICKRAEATGYSQPGGYAEYLVAPAAFCARIPAGTDLYEMAPILCAGVTTYRGLKRTGARPGQWVAVIGVGGLGHIAIQYARAMGLKVAAVDVAPEKLALATRLGAALAVNAAETDPVAAVQERLGGVHGAIVTAVAPRAFEQSIGMLRPAGTVSFIGLPGGDKDTIRASIAAITNWELTIRGSNVGTRLDLDEAVDFAANGLIKPMIEKVPMGEINAIFARMRHGRLVGRAVLEIR